MNLKVVTLASEIAGSTLLVLLSHRPEVAAVFKRQTRTESTTGLFSTR